LHNLELILTLAAGFIAALIFGYITHRLGWSPIVGYLVAGVLVGPHTPGFVANRQLADQLAEIGVILLMFGVGLHFHVKDLLAVRGVAIAGAICQSAIATLLGALASRAFGWDWSAGVVYGLALSVASTVVLTRVLADNNELQSPTGRIAIGWLVMEDIFTVFVLVLLPVIFATSSGDESSSLTIAFLLATAKLAAFVAFTLLAGGRFIPWVLNKVASTHSRELFTLSVLAITLGIAVGSTYFFGVSMALGAFLAGMVVGQSDFSARAGSEALPMRDAFAVMFFLSVGMLLDPMQIIAAPIMSLATAAIVMIGKPVAALLIVALVGYSSRIGFGVAIALAQIGEFSFLLAVLGRDLGVLPMEAMNPLVTVAIVSITLNPVLYPTVTSLETFLRRRPTLWRLFNRRNVATLSTGASASGGEVHQAVVVGYGPIGQTVARLLSDRGIEPTIVEMNIETFRKLKAQNRRVVHGDASQEDVLEKAGIHRAASIILTASGSNGSAEAIRQARNMNPEIHIVARADYLGQSEVLIKAGADEVFSGEGELVLAMTDSILRELGTTPDQLEEERERIRKDLFHSDPGTAPNAS
jgi:CPA2 family monovalent cation:H+ antiporter-2